MIRIVRGRRWRAVRVQASRVQALDVWVDELRDRIRVLSIEASALNNQLTAAQIDAYSARIRAHLDRADLEELRAEAEQLRDTKRVMDRFAEEVAQDIAMFREAIAASSDGEEIEGRIALVVLRNAIDKAKEDGDADELAHPVRLLDMLLNPKVRDAAT